MNCYAIILLYDHCYLVKSMSLLCLFRNISINQVNFDLFQIRINVIIYVNLGKIKSNGRIAGMNKRCHSADGKHQYMCIAG